MTEYIERTVVCMEAGYIHGFGDDKYVSLKDIESIPAADVAPVVHGRWIGTDKRPHLAYKCSACEAKRYGKVDLINYCPNCGARMDGE